MEALKVLFWGIFFGLVIAVPLHFMTGTGQSVPDQIGTGAVTPWSSPTAGAPVPSPASSSQFGEPEDSGSSGG